MTFLISHRGNILGPNEEKENCPKYIEEALINYDVEIDVWLVDGNYFLGHDKPIYPINKAFLQNQKLWCHAKNLEALTGMLKDNQIHCFWHQEDDVALTSSGFIWTYPGKKIAEEKAIAVIPEKNNFEWDISKAEGICSDFVGKYHK